MTISKLWSTNLLETITDLDGKKIISEIENNPNWEKDWAQMNLTGELLKLYNTFQDSARAVLSDTDLADEPLFCPAVTMGKHMFGDSMDLHYHGYAVAVCIFYPDTNEDGGDLVLVDPRGAHFLHKQTFSKASISIKPSANKLVAFPGYVMHEVKSNFTKLPRYSVASVWYLGKQQDYIRYILQQ